VAAGLLLVALPWFWLSRNWHLHAMIGALLYLTILRPLPDVGSAFLYDRLLDGVWFLLVTAILGYQFVYKRRRLRTWSGGFWLLAGTVVVLVSLLVGSLLGQPIIIRDFFELYRGPYYFLVLLLATQVVWDDEDLGESFYKPLLAGLAIAFVVSVLQGLGGTGITIVSPIYTPKSAEPIFSAFSSYLGSGYGFYLQNSGTFGNPNWYGVALGVVLPFLMAGWFIRGRRWLRLAIWGTGIVAFAMICASGSRTGLFVGTLTVFGFFGLWVLESWKRPSIAHVAPRMVGRWVPLSLFVVAVAILFSFTAIKGERYHDTIVTFARVLVGSADFTELRDVLDDIKIGRRTDVSGTIKLDGATDAFREAWNRSPVFGLGPSKAVDPYLGDTQYSKLFYRYGIVGLIVWFGFWVAVLWRTLRLWWRASTPVQAAMLRAVLVSVPPFLVAGILGAFFDARQIATLFLILIGVALSCRGQMEKQPSPDLSSAPAEIDLPAP
ncbi:MAG: hypothetical protein IIB33_01380, partial [Chloroflexi bacterium]|nr:hypothetical protein [Chloroflexota bacterium]